MRRTKIHSNEGLWGPGSIQTLVKEYFFESRNKNKVYYEECMLAAKRYELKAIGGRKPGSIAAAIVYTKGAGYFPRTVQDSVCKFFGVTEVSARNNRRYLREEKIL